MLLKSGGGEGVFPLFRGPWQASLHDSQWCFIARLLTNILLIILLFIISTRLKNHVLSTAVWRKV